MTETNIAGSGRFWPIAVDAEEIPEAGPVILLGCNDMVAASDRNASSGWVQTGGRIAGTTWRFEARNTAHDPRACLHGHDPATEPLDAFLSWRLYAGPWGPGVPSEGADARVLVNLSPLPIPFILTPGNAEQGYNPGPYSVLPMRAGVLVVPEGLVTADSFGFGVAPDYVPGPVTIDECFEIRLWCLDCEEQAAAGGGKALLRGHGALAGDF